MMHEHWYDRFLDVVQVKGGGWGARFITTWVGAEGRYSSLNFAPSEPQAMATLVARRDTLQRLGEGSAHDLAETESAIGALNAYLNSSPSGVLKSQYAGQTLSLGGGA